TDYGRRSSVMLWRMMSLNKFAAVAALVLPLAASACSKNTTTPTATTTCTVTPAAPSASSFGPEGGTGTVAVTARAGCPWTAVSTASFTPISQGATGNGNGAVPFAVAATTGTADRSGTVAIGGTNVTITQRGVTTTPVTLGAPTPVSPVGGITLDAQRPTLV